MSDLFRGQLRKNELGWEPVDEPQHTGQPRFTFHVSSGDFRTLQDPQAVMRMLELVRRCGDYAPRSRYLLTLQAKQAELGPPASFEVHRHREDDGQAHTTLREWLEQNGCDLGKFPV